MESSHITTTTVTGTCDGVAGLAATYRVDFTPTGDTGGGVEGQDFAVGTVRIAG